MKRTIIYVPGLGDRYQAFRKVCLNLWTVFGTCVILFDAKWSSDESLGDKQQRLQQVINRHDTPVIIGESAGATLCLQQQASDPQTIHGVVTLCGVCSPELPIGDYYQRHLPIFVESARNVPAHSQLNTHAIRCIRAWRDSAVPRPHSAVSEAKIVTLWSIGHLPTIALGLTLFAPLVIRQARKL